MEIFLKKVPCVKFLLKIAQSVDYFGRKLARLRARFSDPYRCFIRIKRCEYTKNKPFKFNGLALSLNGFK